MHPENADRSPSSDARDAFLIGAFFLLYGLLVWYATGGTLRGLLPRPRVPAGIRAAFDPNALLAWGTPDDRPARVRMTDDADSGA